MDLWYIYASWGKLQMLVTTHTVPDSKVHGANMGPTWVLSAPDGPHAGPMNLAIRGAVPLQGCWFSSKFSQNTWHSSPLLGLEMRCFLCGQIFIYIWPQSLQRCMQYHVILYHVITASDCICNTRQRWIKLNLSIQQWIILYFFIWNCWLLTL